MSNYLLNASDDSKKIVKIVKKKAFTFESSSRKYEYIKNITIYRDEYIEKIAIRKFAQKLKRLLDITDDVCGSTSTDPSDCAICLNEAYKLQEILKTKYKEYLTVQAFDYFLEQIYIVTKRLEQKNLQLTYIEPFSYEYEFYPEESEITTSKGR